MKSNQQALYISVLDQFYHKKKKMYQPGECRNTQTPGLLDYQSDGYLNYFCFGWSCPMFAAWRLGDKYKVSLIYKTSFSFNFKLKCNLCIWLTGLFCALGCFGASVYYVVALTGCGLDMFDYEYNSYGSSDTDSCGLSSSLALMIVIFITGVVGTIVILVGFILLRRKVSKNRFVQHR